MWPAGMYSLTFSPDVADWVANQIWGSPEFSPCQAIGVERDGALIAGVVYHDFRGIDLQMSCASIDPRWLSKERLRIFFAYPFTQCGCLRVSTVAARANKRARRLNEGLGFKLEGVARKAWQGKDACLYGMLREECHWLGEDYGQEIAKNAACA